MTAIEFDGRDIQFAHPSRRTPEVKEFLGGRYDKKTGRWALPPTSLNMLMLQEWYGDDILEGADPALVDLAVEPWGFPGFSDGERARAEAHPKWSTLYDFQKEGVEYVTCNPHGATLCGLSWGMGKGAVSCVSADLLEAKKVLVLAPLTLAPAWLGEFAKWTEGRDVRRATAKSREPGPEVTIANHEVIQEVVHRDEYREIVRCLWRDADGEFHKWDDEAEEFGYAKYTAAKHFKQWREDGPQKELPSGKMAPVRERRVQVRRDYAEVEWGLIVIDESVLLKNRKSVKVDLLKSLRKKSDCVVLELSGSPITKFRSDLWSQMAVLMPRAFPSFWRFTEFFCIVDKGGWGWTIEGDKPDRDPQIYLKDFYWVKSQDEALPDLPEYIEQHLTVEARPDQRKALDSMLDDWIIELEGSEDEPIVAANALARITRLMQATSDMVTLGSVKTSSAKLDLLVDLIRDDQIKTPLLVWTWYRDAAVSVRARLDSEFPDLRSAFVSGAMNQAAKDSTIQAYKSGDLDILVMQMGIGKFGHTFTHTKTVYYHDRSFDSDAYVQSLARVRRIGLKHTPSLIIPKIQHSADELIDLNLEGKLGNMARLTNANLARLIRTIRDPEL